jgi:hypothetical protein
MKVAWMRCFDVHDFAGNEEIRAFRMFVLVCEGLI